jgi:hypothetical protein
MLAVRKISHVLPVRVVDGVPQCPCCQEPMAEREGGWMCPLGATVLDWLMATTTPQEGRD